jgi:U3 small nucleolar RNA-associated protein 25
LLNTAPNANGPARKKRKLKNRDEERHAEEAEPSDAVDEIPDSQDEMAADQAPTEDEDEGPDDEGLEEDRLADGIESDPFDTHFAQPDAVDLARKIRKADEKWAATKSELPGELRVVTSFPESGEKPTLPSPPKTVRALTVSLRVS